MAICGYHFHPTAEQLVSYYLKSKVEGKPFPAIPEIVTEEVELYGCWGGKEPWELFRDVSTPNKSFYVFTKLEKKSDCGKKIKRVAGCGTWDLQNTHDVVGSEDGHETVIGQRRMFRYEVKGKVAGTRKKVPRWIMHEYTLVDVPSYALCEIKNVVTEKEMDCLEGDGRRKRSASVTVNGDGGKRIRIDDRINDPSGSGNGGNYNVPLLVNNGNIGDADWSQVLMLPSEPNNGYIGNYEDSDVMIDVEDLFSSPTTDPPLVDHYGSSLAGSATNNILIHLHQSLPQPHYLPPHDSFSENTCKNITRVQPHWEQERSRAVSFKSP